MPPPMLRKSLYQKCALAIADEKLTKYYIVAKCNSEDNIDTPDYYKNLHSVQCTYQSLKA